MEHPELISTQDETVEVFRKEYEEYSEKIKTDKEKIRDIKMWMYVRTVEKKSHGTFSFARNVGSRLYMLNLQNRIGKCARNVGRILLRGQCSVAVVVIK